MEADPPSRQSSSPEMAMNDESEPEDINLVAEEEEEEGENEEGEQEDAGEDEDDDGVGAQPPVGEATEIVAAQPDAGSSKPKRKPKAPSSNQLNREYGGKALLPVTRVQKIIKADKWMTATIGRESTWVISRAAEEFVRRLMTSGYHNAVVDKHNTVSINDIVKVIRRNDEYMFIDEIISPMAKDPPSRRAPGGGRGKKAEDAPQGQSMLDGFVAGKPAEEPEEVEDGDVVMDEDGAMSFVPRAKA